VVAVLLLAGATPLVQDEAPFQVVPVLFHIKLTAIADGVDETSSPARTTPRENREFNFLLILFGLLRDINVQSKDCFLYAKHAFIYH